MFKDVSESYPTDGDIVIRYVNKSGQVESPDDSIGLFLIGWKKVSEAVATLRASDHVIEEGTGDKKLVMSSTLFCDKITDGQFYQLCYISYASKPDEKEAEKKGADKKGAEKNGAEKKGAEKKGAEAVIGASCAFCIRRASSDDMVMLPARLTPTDGRETDGQGDGDSSETDDEEFIVVKSEQALIQERLQSLVTNNGLLEFQCKSLGQRLHSAEEELYRVKGEKMKIEGQFKSGQETVQHVTNLLSEIRKKESIHEGMMIQLRQENQHLAMELKRVASLKQMEIEGLKQERISVSKKEEQIKAEHDETMNLLATLLDEKEHWITEKEHLVKIHTDFKNMIDHSKDELMKLTLEKEEISNYLRQVSEELVQKNEDLVSMRNELVRKDSELRELEEKWKTLSDQVDHWKGMESEVVKCRAVNSDLEEMIQILQSDLSQAELKAESQAKSSASVKAVSADQTATIEDLTRRLKKAAEEYVELKRSKVKTETKYEKLKTKVDVSN